MAKEKLPYQRSMGSTNVEYGVPRKPIKSKQKTKRSKKTGKRNLGWLYLLVVVLILSGSLYYGLEISGKTIVRDVVVNGIELSTKEDVLTAANIPSGIAIDSLNMMEVMERISVLPFVKRVNLHVSPTGRLDVEITERVPVGLLVQGDAMALVDEEGHKMPVSGIAIPDVPLIYGFSINPLNEPVTSTAFTDVISFVKSAQKNVINDISISEVGWHRDSGVIALTREGGVKLMFGKGNYSVKLSNWLEFNRTVIPVKGMAAFSSLDFRFKGQIIAQEL